MKAQRGAAQDAAELASGEAGPCLEQNGVYEVDGFKSACAEKQLAEALCKSVLQAVTEATRNILEKVWERFDAALALQVQETSFFLDVKERFKTHTYQTTKLSDAVGGVAGALAGGRGGASVGAVIGTAILPGPGTLIGGFLGGMFGGLAGGAAGRAIGRGVWTKTVRVRVSAGTNAKEVTSTHRSKWRGRHDASSRSSSMNLMLPFSCNSLLRSSNFDSRSISGVKRTGDRSSRLRPRQGTWSRSAHRGEDTKVSSLALTSGLILNWRSSSCFFFGDAIAILIAMWRTAFRPIGPVAMLVERISSFEKKIRFLAAAAAEGISGICSSSSSRTVPSKSSNLLQDAFQKSLRDLAGIQPGHLRVDHRLNELARRNANARF